VSEWVPIASVVASAAVGLGVPAVVTRHERRDLRADVLRRVGDVERLRWAPSEWDEFRQAIFALRGSALVAGASREIVDRYIFLAHVARRASDAAFEVAPDPEFGGGIWGPLADLTTDAATMLAEHLWHPVRKRRLMKRWLRDNRKAEDALRQGGDDDGDSLRIDWAPPRF
jgi:hypothetical protein